MSAKNKGVKGAKTKQRTEKAKPGTKLIPELAAMKFPAKMLAKLEALAEADQDTVLNYVNSGMKINDAYQRTIAGKAEQQQQPEPEAATPTAEGANPQADCAGQPAQATPTPGAETTSAAEATQAADPGTQPAAKKRGRAPKAKAETGPKKLSAIDAAARVLAEAGEPMDCQTMIKTMAEKGYWTSPAGKTPAATLYSAILREISIKGKDARFTKTERGKSRSARHRSAHWPPFRPQRLACGAFCRWSAFRPTRHTRGRTAPSRRVGDSQVRSQADCRGRLFLPRYTTDPSLAPWLVELVCMNPSACPLAIDFSSVIIGSISRNLVRRFCPCPSTFPVHRATNGMHRRTAR